MPQTTRTDPAIIFRSKKVKEFCRKRYIEHIQCPIRDHKGNGKIERLIRTINERLRTNKEIVIKRDKSGNFQNLQNSSWTVTISSRGEAQRS